MKTLRQIFDQVKDHLLKQQVAAKDDSTGECHYHTDNGHQCAVGCLIDEAYYDPCIEGLAVTDIRHSKAPTRRERAKILEQALIQSGINTDDTEVFILLEGLQTIHDEVKEKHWPSHLKTMEKDYFSTV
ncbi:hypothetical protein [Endozoicomonas sp. ALC066]|uniref:hypothetical protein n=1 Tax=Endozoicomonas sp. ALC066 TaxID=3403078 RepID=UPI003BB53B4B